MSWFWGSDQLDRIENTLNRVHTIQLPRIEGKVTAMAISQEQFDTDLAALIAAEAANGQAVVDLVAAVEAALATKPPADLTAEDEAVQAAAATAAQTAQTLAEELAKLAPPA